MAAFLTVCGGHHRILSILSTAPAEVRPAAAPARRTTEPNVVALAAAWAAATTAKRCRGAHGAQFQQALQLRQLCVQLQDLGLALRNRLVPPLQLDL